MIITGFAAIANEMQPLTAQWSRHHVAGRAHCKFVKNTQRLLQKCNKNSGAIIPFFYIYLYLYAINLKFIVAQILLLDQ